MGLRKSAKWFSYNNEEPVYWKNSGGSLSLQGYEKRIGAGNTQTSGAEISPVPEIEMEVLRMGKLFYPAIFHKAEEGGFWISFPDIPECLTEGDDMQQAYEMAVEALGLALVNRKEEKEEIPVPSEIDRIQGEDGTLVIVEFDMQEYLRKHNSKAVKKTLSIPEWLNEEATAMGVNFSQVLQEALMSKLNIGR